MVTRRFFHTGKAANKIVPTNLKGKSGSSQRWLQRQLADPYVEKARLMNYRCRSAFKLIEIDDKHQILRPGMAVMDCGCAPGSWSQVLVRRVNADGETPKRPRGLVIGADLSHVYPLKYANLLGNVDFTSEDGHARIRESLGVRKLGAVVSDMAPRATGVRSLDQENIIMLCYAVLRFAVQFSEVGSSLLVKCWSCEMVPKLEKDMQRYYKTVRNIKPGASRTDSAEMFLLGKNFLGLEGGQ